MDRVADELASIAARYERFASTEARGVSPLYEHLAQEVAAEPKLLMFLASLPLERRQPNLFLAAVRHVCGLAGVSGQLLEFVETSGTRIRDIMLSRATQTNEPARCAVLLPALARLPQPLALLEVGASAGLCLLGDRYGYDYGRVQIDAPASGIVAAPVFSCDADDATPLPRMHPQIVWRAGLDLNPLDVTAAADVAWLETLVWPGQDHRVERLRTAIDVARSDPPCVYRGNLSTDLPALVASAPKGAHLVIFHTAVLAYVASRSERHAFVDFVRASGATWISNEAPSVFPDHAVHAGPQPSPAQFLLAVDGTPVAWTGPHGQSITWLKP